MAWPLFLVQTKAATPFHPPPPWELQFRGDRFLLGSASRHLSPCRVWRMSCNIWVTATSANGNVTIRHRANFRLPKRDIRLLYRSPGDGRYRPGGPHWPLTPLSQPTALAPLASVPCISPRLSLWPAGVCPRDRPWPAYRGGFRESPEVAGILLEAPWPERQPPASTPFT